jgi:hypothetical protein
MRPLSQGERHGESVESLGWSADKPRPISTTAVIGLGLLTVVSGAVAYLGRSIVPQVVSLYQLDLPANPYFQPEGAGLLYVLTPLVVLSSLVLFLLPGLFLVLARGRTEGWTALISRAFGAAFLAYVVLTSAVKWITPVPPDPRAFIAALACSGVLTWALLAFRVFRGTQLPWPLSRKEDARRLCWTIAIPAIALLALFPVIFWQDMHDDGLEALELGRSLSANYLPRFPTPTGLLGISAGMLPMAYPVHWFVTLFGAVEASARLPMLLYLPVLFCLLIELIEWRSPRQLGFAEEAVLCLALAAYTVTMSYNASYDVYFADIAAPAAFETLTIVCIAAAIYFLWSGHDLWFFFFGLLSYLCRPNGLLVLGLLGLAVAICVPERRRPLLLRISGAIVLCVAVGWAYDKIYIPRLVGDASFGYPASSILARYRYLTIDDLSRVLYVLVPCGILPLISLLAFRWQDPLGRVLSVVSITYFAAFYFPAFVALHHFVPVMILPLVVFWRMYLHRDRRFRDVSLRAVALTSAMAIWLSLPRRFEINRTVRAIGQRTAYLVGDYDTDYREQVRHFELCFELIPPDWEVEDPTTELVSGYMSIIYYSTRPKAANTEINYIVQYARDPAPPGFTRISDDGVAALYIKDMQQWQRDRFRPLRTDYRSPLYDIPRATMHAHWGVRQGQYSIDLKPLLLDSWSGGRRIRDFLLRDYYGAGDGNE